jgi:alkyl sulfatase BDS1-like metallo-beta-lactamase superfamily hydrolase
MARAGLTLAMETLKSSKPVVAVIYTHSHVDHFGGARGVVDEADVRSGKVKIIAPEGFRDNAIAENVLAGNAMTRRANYMYGISLPANDKGSVGTGLGMALSIGAPGLIPPTVIVKQTGEEMTIDGVRIQFQMAQDTEAPSEMMMYLPRLQMPLAEVADHGSHHHKIVPLPAGLRNPPRRIQPTRIAVQQKRHHHPRGQTAAAGARSHNCRNLP